MADKQAIVTLGTALYAAIAGKNPDPLTAAFARVCAQSIMGAAKVMDQKNPVNLPNLMLNGYTVNELAAMCLRTGLVPGGAGDLCGIYVIPQGSQLRFSISPPGYKELAKVRGHVITARPVIRGCDPDLAIDGTIVELLGSHHKVVTSIDELGGIVVSLNDANTLAHYASYWVDGDVIRQKKADALGKANGRQTPWTSHPMGMAASKALSMVAKMLGLAGERVPYARAEILGAQAALTHDQAKALPQEERARIDLPTTTSATPSPTEAAPTEPPAEAAPTEDQPASQPESAPEQTPDPGAKTLPAQWAEDCKAWPAFTGMLRKKALEFMTEEDVAYFMPQCIDAVGPDLSWTDDTWRNDADARNAVLRRLASLRAEMAPKAR